jgi:hypothetical protein
MAKECARLPRRYWLIGIAALLATPARAQEARRTLRRRAPTPQRAAARAQAAVVPGVDGPPPPSRIPGLEPAPVPNSGLRGPAADRQPRPSVEFGVPTPPVYQQGQTFSADDPAPQVRQPQGLRLPSPGATVRLPF